MAACIRSSTDLKDLDADVCQVSAGVACYFIARVILSRIQFYRGHAHSLFAYLVLTLQVVSDILS